MEANNNALSEVTALIRSWEDEHSQPSYNPVPTLTRLAELIEIQTENYLKMDPDPFDERHPSRTDPDCKFGLILKALFRKDNFMNKLVTDYLRDTYYSRLGVTGDIDQLNIAACRLMLDLLPGLETSAVFQPDMDSLIHRLIKWTTDSIEPLQSYATGLLAAAMEIPEIATRFREHNGRLVPLLLQRLRRLQVASEFPKVSSRPFAHLACIRSPPFLCENHKSKKNRENGSLSPLKRPNCDNAESLNESDGGQKRKKARLEKPSDVEPITIAPAENLSFLNSDTSNSSWAELESFMIGNMQMFPPTLATRQILILKYLAPMGEYQEFLSHVFENNALELILCYVNVRETKEARLAFEALKYLSALLCHKKFSIEFIDCQGLEALLEVPRPSIAATGVSICLYYLGYCEEAMEKVCTLSKYIISTLVRYALWLLECSHDSGRCHAIMFFGLTFQFKAILEEFDLQDGLRKLHNVIATLPILLPQNDENNTPPLNEDAECAARQIVRHVCVAYKRYLEAHLYIKTEQLRRSQLRPNERILQTPPVHRVQPGYKACKSSPEEIQQQTELLLNSMPFRAHWAPVDELLQLGGITLLLKIIAFAYEWNYSGRAETVRCALDVLAISCVMPQVQLLFCERVDLPEEAVTVGINIILGAADGEIVADADVQKAALRVIVNCVCGPIHRVGGSLARYSATAITSPTVITSPTKKTKYKSSEELIQKVWESVRSNSGIMVLLQLMNVKTPITDADCIRTLACKALTGLARSETVRQIVSKLPLFTNGQLQNLMRDPILQEKRQEHVTFQKYALELLGRLSGKTKPTGNDLEVSLSNIHRANVVAQTKIQFNERQLLQLIHQHLVSKGLTESASVLQKEAHLANSIVNNNLNLPSKFRYPTPQTPSRIRLSINSPLYRSASTSSIGSSETVPSTSNTTNSASVSTPIKLIKKTPSTPQNIMTVQNSRLQKQISSEPHLKVLVPNQNSEEINGEPQITLDSIITEYLTNQHALCKNPMATCPQFNLFVPHKCPDPKPRINTANNFVMRCTRRAIGYQCKAMDRKFIHSRFCPVQTIRLPTEEGFFTCARFMPGDQSVIVGCYTGEVRLFNLHNGNEESMFQAHDSYIVHLEPNRDGNLLLTSSTWGRPLSALWSSSGNSYTLSLSFEDEEYVEFSKVMQDRIIGTKGEVATIYDVASGKRLLRLSANISNQYTKNKATFSTNDELVLSDGVLFDVHSGKQIHKLDKLNQTQSGVFHPNGLEIVSNTEVWDIRTFHLLKTVPALNQCQVTFSPANNAIYAIAMEQEIDDDTTFDSSFKTVDAIDYSSIATVDVKKNIYDLAVNKYDTQIAIVENQGMYHSVQESVVRLYDVGRRRDDEDEQEEDDDEEDMDGSDDDGSDNEGPVLLDVIAEPAIAENNDNNDGDDDDNDRDYENNTDQGGSSGSDSWSSISDDSSIDSLDSADMDDIEDILRNNR